MKKIYTDYRMSKYEVPNHIDKVIDRVEFMLFEKLSEETNLKVESKIKCNYYKIPEDEFGVTIRGVIYLGQDLPKYIEGEKVIGPFNSYYIIVGIKNSYYLVYDYEEFKRKGDKAKLRKLTEVEIQS